MNTEQITKGLQHVANIEKQLFDVAKVPLYPPTLDAFKETFGTKDAEQLGRPDYFATYKTTGGSPLGTIGKDFTPTQPRELFSSFVECLSDVSELDLSTIQYRELKGGAKVQFIVKLPSISFKNAMKVGDEVATNLVIQTGYDGLTKTTFNLETLRLICTNGMTVRGTEAGVSFKNTKHNVGKLSIATDTAWVAGCEQIIKMIDQTQSVKKAFQLFDKTEVTRKEVDAYVKKVFGYSNTERAELGKVKTERLDQIMASFDLEMSRTGNTVWGMLNGVTHFTNHIAETDNREDYMLTGAGLLTNDKAQKFALELVKP